SPIECRSFRASRHDTGLALRADGLRNVYGEPSGNSSGFPSGPAGRGPTETKSTMFSLVPSVVSLTLALSVGAPEPQPPTMESPNAISKEGFRQVLTDVDTNLHVG